MASQRLLRLGYRILGLGETAIKDLFDMPRDSPCADLVAVDSRGMCIVVECKGAGIRHAVEQLNATVSCVKKRYASIQSMIIVNRPVPSRGRQMPHLPLGQGYVAKYLQYSNGHVLVAPNGLEVTLDTGRNVLVEFDSQ